MPAPVQALIIGLGIAGVIAILLLTFGERPKLAAAVRRRIGGEAARPEAWDDDDYTMSSGEDDGDDFEPLDPPKTPATTSPQNNNNGIAIGDNERNALLFAGKADALAAMVHAGKVNQTDGIWIVYNVKPSSTNQTYQAARAMLQARLERLQGPQPGDPRPLTDAQRALREELGLQ